MSSLIILTQTLNEPQAKINSYLEIDLRQNHAQLQQATARNNPSAHHPCCSPCRRSSDNMRILDTWELLKSALMKALNGQEWTCNVHVIDEAVNQ